MDPIPAQLVALVADAAKVDPSCVTPEADLRDGLGLSSLDMIDLAVAAEDRFGVRIPDDDTERFRTVGDLAAFLRGAAGAQPGPP